MSDNSIVGAVATASANLCNSDSIPGTDSNTWIIDTGASDHMTYDAKFLDELSSNTHDPHIISANGLPSPITGEGTISLTPTLSLSRALLVLNIHYNLLSVGQLLDTINASTTFYPTHCSFQDLKTYEMIGHGKRIGGLYYLTLPSAPVRDRVVNTIQSCNVKDKQQIWLWHRRLGQPSFGYLKRLFPSLFCSSNDSSFKCETCILAKSHCTVFSLSDNKAAKPYSDVWGPVRVISNEFRWFVTFTNDCTRLTWVFLLKNKHDVVSILPELCTMVSIQFHARVKVFQTDNGGEYVNNTLASFFRAQVSKLPPKFFWYVAYVHVYSHQLSELDLCAMRCIFIDYSYTQKGYHPPTQKVHVPLDLTFHEEVPYYVSFSSPIQGEMVSELESLGFKNDVFEDTAFGKETTCRTEASDRSPISEDKTCGLCEEKTDRPLELDRSPISGDEAGALDVETTVHTEASDQSPVSENNDSDSCMDEFDTIPPSALPMSQSTCDSESSEVISNDLSVSTYQLPSRTTCGNPKIQYSPNIYAKSKYLISHYVSTHCLSKSYASYLCQLSSICVPTKLQDALSNPKWMDAMNVVMDALNKNKTWDLVHLPRGKKAVGCRWVFTLKHKADGSIDRDQARLVAKGYTQTFGVDYLETFASVAKLNTVCVLLSLAANRDWPLLQFDVKNAFLHSDLNEEIYMVSLMSNSDYALFLKRHKETGMLDCKPIDTSSEQNHKFGLYPDQVPTDKERYQ
ncbi:hypothetical protein L3X38_001817 [Prunus dulcis]|uniref:Integrase catalytic domain-containing protein n=1 Tax=Prunus dulcis TaxID=3755 RepID=A0AAD4WST9_PRUDU|nr:hypothetical protein L3X38_001817 [Prunus dulcis]